jgi:hypothetical protein
MFERFFGSVRRWLQHLHGFDQPVYMIVKRNGDDVAYYLECELDVTGEAIVVHRWTRNPSRANIFGVKQKDMIKHGMPADGFWLPIIEMPLYRSEQGP